MKQVPLNLGGNKCGHDRTTPDWRLVKPIKTGKGGLPRVLTLAVERLIRYYENPAFLPSLNHANGSDRQQRTERREACVILLAALIQAVDVVSLRVGIPTPGGFFNKSLEHIYKQTHLSHSRAERAFADLKAAGIVTVKQARIKNADDSWSAEVAVKAIAASFFGAMGLARILKAERKRQSRAVKNSAPEGVNLSGQGRTALYMSMLTRRAGGGSQGKVKADKARVPNDLTTDQRKAFSRRLVALREQYPDADHDQLRAQALSEI